VDRGRGPCPWPRSAHRMLHTSAFCTPSAPLGWAAAILLLATGAAGSLNSQSAPAALGHGGLDGTALLQVRAEPNGGGAPKQQGAAVPGEEAGRASGTPASRPPSSGRLPDLRRMQLVAPPEVHLLVSLVLRGRGADHPHVQEMLAAFQANLENADITSVHVLLETPGESSSSCDTLPAAMRSATGIGVDPSDFGKVTCSRWTRQPTYADFFRYANSSMSSTGNIVLANADVVFDGTLRRMMQLRPGSEGHLISVRAPHFSGTFKALWRVPCTTVLDKCSRETHSWDAYAFSLPLPPGLLGADLDFPMNVISADHRAAFALSDSGLTLTNPCMHINAFHWHCFSTKMHANFTNEYLESSPRYATDRPGLIKTSYPCLDFPLDEFTSPACRQ